MKNVNINVTRHAHAQYCSRVGPIGHEELEELVASLIATGDFVVRRRGFIQIGGVWWIQQRDGNTIYLLTCYGRTDMDLPKAIGWAARGNDRINLKHML